MDMIEELEAMRKRVLQEINAEFDLMIARMERMEAQEEVPYESTYSLTAGAGIFRGTKPTSVIFPDGKRADVRSWKDVAEAVMKRCVEDPQNALKLMELAGRISGRKRTLLASSGDGMRSPLKIREGLYMETHYDVETLLNVLTVRILGAIQYDHSGIKVTIRNR